MALFVISSVFVLPQRASLFASTASFQVNSFLTSTTALFSFFRSTTTSHILNCVTHNENLIEILISANTAVPVRLKLTVVNSQSNLYGKTGSKKKKLNI